MIFSIIGLKALCAQKSFYYHVPCYVYILYSSKLERFYVGSTNNLERRLREHNDGASKYTAQGMPWNVIWCIRKPNRNAAETLERKLKNLSRKRKLRFIQKHKMYMCNELIFNAIGGSI